MKPIQGTATRFIPFLVAGLISVGTYADELIRVWKWQNPANSAEYITLDLRKQGFFKIDVVKGNYSIHTPQTQLPPTSQEEVGLQVYEIPSIAMEVNGNEQLCNVVINYSGQDPNGDDDDRIVLYIVPPAGTAIYAAPQLECVCCRDRCGRCYWCQRWVCVRTGGNPCDPDEEILIPHDA